MKYYLIYIVLSSLPVMMLSQDDSLNVKKKITYPWSYKKEIALNVTNLVQRFIPLNLLDFSEQSVAVKAKWYGRKAAFRMDLGADVPTNITPNVPRMTSFHISMGYERKVVLWKGKWAYTTGALLTIEQKLDDGIAGVQKHIGIEYNLNPNVQLSTETSLFAGSVFGDFGFIFRPPTALYLQVRF